jgi:hypothetical protein
MSVANGGSDVFLDVRGAKMMAGGCWNRQLVSDWGNLPRDGSPVGAFDRNLDLPSFAADAALQQSAELRASSCNLSFYGAVCYPQISTLCRGTTAVDNCR